MQACQGAEATYRAFAAYLHIHGWQFENKLPIKIRIKRQSEIQIFDGIHNFSINIMNKISIFKKTKSLSFTNRLPCAGAISAVGRRRCI